MAFALTFRPSAVQDFEALPAKVQVRIAQTIEALGVNPFYPNTKALQGNLWPFRRARVGDYRIIYLPDLEQQRVTIVAIGLRSDIYKRLSRMSN
ncbi:MAG: type II toxin-antitoxin system RelE family toxin [Armatimonadota bacterium]